jgi:hypothetical protein
MEELFKLLLVTILDKTLLKCLVSNLKIKRKLKSMLGKQVGVLQPDLLVFSPCTTPITKV